MIKKEYQKPTMKVVQLQQRTMILAGSGGLRSVHNTGFDDTEDEFGISDTPGTTWGR
jgi:hypothetical protein